MKSNFYILILSSVILFACCKKEDLGAPITVSITLPAFDQIKHDANIDVQILQGSKQSVEFDGYDLVLNDIDMRVVNGTLIINQLGHYWSTGNSTIYIIVPDLSLIETSSSGDIESAGRFTPKGSLSIISKSNGDIYFDIDAKDVYTILDGSGDLRLTGYADNHDIEFNASGYLYAFNLRSDRVRIEHHGFGHAEINAQRDLYVRVRASGNVYFTGRPYLNYSVTGSGRLIDAN